MEEKTLAQTQTQTPKDESSFQCANILCGPIFQNAELLTLLLYRISAQLVARLVQESQIHYGRRAGSVQFQKPLAPSQPRLAWCRALPCSSEMHMYFNLLLLCWSSTSTLKCHHNPYSNCKHPCFLDRICLFEMQVRAYGIHGLSVVNMPTQFDSAKNRLCVFKILIDCKELLNTIRSLEVSRLSHESKLPPFH